MFTPASRQMSTRRVAPSACVEPHALKKSLPPPNVAVPRLRTGTFSPDPPSCRNSMRLPTHARRRADSHLTMAGLMGSGGVGGLFEERGAFAVERDPETVDAERQT